MSLFRRIIEITAMPLIALLILLMILFWWWLIVPDRVVVVKNPMAIQVDKKVYHPGDRLTYTIDYCKTRPIMGKVSRALVDGYRLMWETVYSNLPVGCHKIEVNELKIHPYAPPGIYHLEITADYQVNPLQIYEVRENTVDFQIVK